MAKVYDALQRAERERKRAASDVMPSVAPLDVPAAPPKARAKLRPAKAKRSLVARLRDRLGRQSVVDTSAEVNKRRISVLQPDSYVAEQFRALRGRIDALAEQRPIRTVVVSSPMAGEGKTTASINLACVTAMSVGRRVLLIDCDMRKPKVHQALGLRPEAGLAEVLAGKVAFEDAVITIEGMNLDVLAVRSRPSNPSELLGSPRMRELVEKVAGSYDRVILDTPAALGLPDAKAVSELADGVVVVVRADVTSQQDLEAALEALDRRRLLGLVLNGAHVDHGRYGYTS
ncbi:MAG: CpsD/CapB family tyrosine-protein kinase [Deltaproteobacteria bacterium]|nr:CpsD/CapB family tyrosine-protein kinase [Deltaproteobacteria bacterium]MBW2360323.1 CpsD/CapB family tyrosine-protein kinase [Deltaproteobacteria bacterium]